MKTVGIDPSATSTGICIVGDGFEQGKAIHFINEKGMQRVQSIAKEVGRTLGIWEPKLAVVEGYAYGNHHTLVTLVEVGTIIRNVLFCLGIKYYEVSPSTLKKWTTGKGNATKDQMALAVKEKWGYNSPSHDIVDAYAMARMAQLGEEAMLEIKGVVLGC